MYHQFYDDDAYDDAYFDRLQQTALESARVVVPLLLRLVQPARVLDVGCGRGAWLSVFREHGVAAVRGVDGPHVNPARLLIDPSCFSTVDLGRPFEPDGRYDLAACLEVAEHLPYETGPGLVQSLTRAAPLVLFSAAVPGQGGTGHINEQWPPYWRKEFARHGYRRLDALRPHILQDERVAWWYRQNLFLFASDEGLSRWPALQAEAERPETEFELVHRNVLSHLNELYRYQSLGGLLREVPRVLWKGLRKRFGLAGTSLTSPACAWRGTPAVSG